MLTSILALSSALFRPAASPTARNAPALTRRSLLGCLVASSGRPSGAAATQPLGPAFDWTLLWQGDIEDSSPKRTGLTVSQVSEILTRDLSEKQYILTGNLSPEIFRDDCTFVDPNNAVKGLSKYRQALSFLFDPEQSEVHAVRGTISASGKLEVNYIASGVLKLPWRPKIAPWSGHITYQLDADGLVSSQIDVWNITRLDAIRQTFSPG